MANRVSLSQLCQCVRSMARGGLVFLLLASLVSVNATPVPLEFRLFGGKRDESARSPDLGSEPATQELRPQVQNLSNPSMGSELLTAAQHVVGFVPKPETSPVQKVADTCRVSFRLKNDFTKPGDTLLALGNVPSLGNWKDSTALVFTTTSSTFPWWHAQTSVPSGTELEFKFVMKKASGELSWEQGQNRRLFVESATGMTMETSFGDMRSNVDVEGLKAAGTDDERGQEMEARDAGPTDVVESPAKSSKELVSAPTGEIVEEGKEMTARLFFRVRCETKIGENVGVCGGIEPLGAWKPNNALLLKTTADEYPFWSGSADVAVSQVKHMLKYKYLIKHPQGEWWEDGIADRTVERDASTKGGTLSPGLDTYVDDGSFNVLQRICTYVREREPGSDKPKLQIHAIQEGTPFEVPEGYQLVSLDQVLQWTAQLEGLEEECKQWRERIEAAESTIVVLTAELEGAYLRVLQRHKQLREDGQIRKLQFVETMDACEDHLNRLEDTVDVVEEKKKKLRAPTKAA